ncbi:hypothetical protein CYLTODRAFT_382513 [Cylindrobasidium torrendii FP15055 ss-10]|uniref:Fungal-type protein kinase domain-containing protein n=1 Tax=Cylindrobasidium torrendii FP15055 ss-10 TaxID=1314674 RepID=A0A0D7B1A3_9AGAR|nr:hypothetical protein CYLTODRAFT_382513 [Cylindrobasidium torrendii FP15055 ss-10]
MSHLPALIYEGDVTNSPPRQPASKSLQATLVKSLPGSTQTLASDNSSFVDDVYSAASKNTRGISEWIPIQELLDLLPHVPGMPDVRASRESLREVGRKGRETDMYTPFVSAMSAYINPAWTLANTSSRVDKDLLGATMNAAKSRAPDLTLFPFAHSELSQADFSLAETLGEFKNDVKWEPFQDYADGIQDGTSNTAQSTRGQLVTYLNAVQALQPRTRVFLFYVNKDQCRILCHTRAGTQVTHLFAYAETDHLHTFLWRLSHASRAARGHDTTISEVKTTGAEEEEARLQLGLKQKDALLKIDMQKAMVQKNAVTIPYLYASAPFTNNHLSAVGQASRCYRAWDPASQRIVLLKESWRSDDQEAEHLIIASLHEGNVPHIPTVLVAGDVRCNAFPSAMLAGNDNPHQTPYVVERDEAGNLKRQRRLLHYRLVIKEFGISLSEFQSTRQFALCLLHGVEAHKGACDVGILHRDISVGNIIIYEGSGLLIDWERAKRFSDNGPVATKCTGTRQFMSIHILQQAENGETLFKHRVNDDLESFIYVALWTAARYAPNSMSEGILHDFLLQFDSTTTIAKRKLALQDPDVAVFGLELQSVGLQTIFVEFFRTLYYVLPDWERVVAFRHRADARKRDEAIMEGKAKALWLFDHEWMIDLLSSVVVAPESAHMWPAGDKAEHNLSKFHPAMHQSKRDLEEGGLGPHAKRFHGSASTNN